MREFLIKLVVFLVFLNTYSFSQFHDYDLKYGIQGHLLFPRTEFDSDSYILSILGRGFVRTELNSYLELEIGVGIGELNGKDFENETWSTNLYPTDLKLLISPFNSIQTSTYFYSGIMLLRWNISNYPLSVSPNPTEQIGWDMSFPFGVGIEISLSEEILLDINGGYTFTQTDDLNYYSAGSNDGFFNFGSGLTFVIGGSLTDKDDDGLTQKFENEIGTNPQFRDSDGDKLNDGEEVKVYKTNPNDTDSDDDGIEDFEEVIKFNTDPNSSDTDGDDLNDFDEIHKYRTNPNEKDTDFDKLSDGYEVNVYRTDPTKNDTDIDRLIDEEEIKKYNTDPLKSDTDGDGVGDGTEILVDKTNPLDATSYKEIHEFDNKLLYLQKNKPVILTEITFETKSAKINIESKEELMTILAAVLSDPVLKIEIRGYTDNVGDSNYNKKLSQQRADSVKIWLVKNGVDALRIDAKGFGELNPISSNDTPEGRRKNRRIEIVRIPR